MKSVLKYFLYFENKNQPNNKDHWYRDKIKNGQTVLIVQKHHQRSGELTKGIVDKILTSKSRHTRGIKVRLKTGEVGRVQKILKK